MTYFLDGGAAKTALKEKIMLQFERDPTMKTIDTPDQDLKTIRERTMQKIARMGLYLGQESLHDFKERMNMLTMFDPASWTRIGVHFGRSKVRESVQPTVLYSNYFWD